MALRHWPESGRRKPSSTAFSAGQGRRANPHHAGRPYSCGPSRLQNAVETLRPDPAVVFPAIPFLWNRGCPIRRPNRISLRWRRTGPARSAPSRWPKRKGTSLLPSTANQNKPGAREKTDTPTKERPIPIAQVEYASRYQGYAGGLQLVSPRLWARRSMEKDC